MKSLTNNRIFAIILIAGLLSSAGIYYFYSTTAVRVVSVKSGSISENIEESGYTRTRESFDIQAPASGHVVSLYVVNGDSVKAGQQVMTLQNLISETQLATIERNIKAAVADRDNAKAIINIAKTDVEEARKDFERRGILLKAGVISQVEYDTVENNLRKSKDTIASLEASLSGAEHRLDSLLSQQKGIAAQVRQMSIVSPISGSLLSLPVKTGQVVPAGAVLATVGSPGALEVYAEILSDEVVHIRSGQEVSVYYGAGNRLSTPGRVKEIFPQAVEKHSSLGVVQRRVPILVALDSNGPLKPGYEVKVSIRTAHRDNTLLIPREVVSVGKDGSETVRIVKGGRVTEQRITVGLKDQFHAEVLKGLAADDRVLADGNSPCREGAKVRVIND